MSDSPMRPIMLARGVDTSPRPSMLSYSELEIRRSWLSSGKLMGCSNTGGLPGASCRARRGRHETREEFTTCKMFMLQLRSIKTKF